MVTGADERRCQVTGKPDKMRVLQSLVDDNLAKHTKAKRLATLCKAAIGDGQGVPLAMQPDHRCLPGSMGRYAQEA